MSLDYYEILQVAPDAEHDLIRRAYRTLAKIHHPDRHGGSPEAQERMRLLNEAYEVLGDPARRAVYDRGREPFEGEEGDETPVLGIALAWLWQLVGAGGRWRWALGALLLTSALALVRGGGPGLSLPTPDLAACASETAEGPVASFLGRAERPVASFLGAAEGPVASFLGTVRSRLARPSPPASAAEAPGDRAAGVREEAPPEPLAASAAEAPAVPERAPAVAPADATAGEPGPELAVVAPGPTPVPADDDRELVAQVLRRYGVLLDGKTFTREELLEQVARIETAQEIRSRYGVNLDWQGYSLGELREHAERLALAQELEQRYSVVLDGRSFGLEELRDIEARIRLAAEIGRDFRVPVDWQGYTLEELEQVRQRLQREAPHRDGPLEISG